MNVSGIKIRIINLSNPREKSEIENFLKLQNISLEKDVDYTVALYESDKLVGTGSLSNKVLKCIAVDENYQGEGLSNMIVSHLVSEAYFRGYTHLFIYTKPMNLKMFKDMGFYKIEEVEDKVVLLENDPKGISGYTKNLSKYKKNGKIISSIVVNCNPFTLGHKYLIEKASTESDVVHVFVLWEDKSIFPNNVRYNLVIEGTKHLPNVIIHKGEDYIISSSTFPSYFLKESSNIVRIHAELDIKIFVDYIAPSLGINRRYVGEEPFCLVTREYNQVMKEYLPKAGIELIEIPRIEENHISISASKVRQIIKDGDLELLKNIVPLTTYEYLLSKEGKEIVNKIQSGNEKS